MQQATIEGFRVSSQQGHIWQISKGVFNPAYRVQCNVIIEGNLELDLLRGALQKLVDRHEILRTSFHCLAGMNFPLQVINDQVEIEIKIQDASEVLEEDQKEQLQEVYKTGLRGYTNSDSESALQVFLLILSRYRHALILELPALCGDPTSMRGLISELGEIYRSSNGYKDQIGQPLQYADFAEWQNGLLKSEGSDFAKSEWRRILGSAHHALTLPFGQNNGEKTPFNPKVFPITLRFKLERLESLAKVYKISLYDLLLACWLIYIQRLTGQSRVAVGIYFDGRRHENLKYILGPVGRYLPLSLDLSREMRFIELVRVA